QVGDEEGGDDAVAVLVGAQADDQGDDLRWGVGGWGGAGELHPHVPVLVVLASVEQAGLHGAVLAAAGVESAGVGVAVQDEGEQHFQGLGLARAVVAAQDQASVGEGELLVDVVPDVDHTCAAGLETITPAAHRMVPSVSCAASVGVFGLSWSRGPNGKRPVSGRSGRAPWMLR